MPWGGRCYAPPRPAPSLAKLYPENKYHSFLSKTPKELNHIIKKIFKNKKCSQ